MYDDLKSIATGILSTGTWPAHLGLNTDTERIGWLAGQIERLCDDAVDMEKLEDRADNAEEERDNLQEEVTERMECSDCVLCDSHKKAE